MANKEHVELLRQGVVVWNRWRKEHPDVMPNLVEADLFEEKLTGADLIRADLRHADLIGADLIGANLHRANLIGANLHRANLRRAYLRRAYLSRANLSRGRLSEAVLRDANLSAANLSEVNLSEVNLSEANLGDTDLRDANLSAANLSGADLSYSYLRKADLSGALLSYTVFFETNLIYVTGLDTCQHLGPSTIDHRTLAKSGNLPKTFLKGCGLPDWLIEAYKLTQPGLNNDDINTIGYEAIRLRAGQPEAIQFHSCFISYSSKDDPFAQRLHQDLQDNGVRCWFAPEHMKIGSRIRPVIDDAIHHHDKFLLILSEHSVESQWVEGEVETALEIERKRKAAGHPETVLFPIRLDEAVMETNEAWASLIRKTRHIGDFCRWNDAAAYNQAFERLLRDLRAS